MILYLFFVGIALIFWFLHSLDKEYIVNVKVNVAYYNFPLDKEPQGNTEQELTLNVKAYGFSLVRMQLKAAFYDYKVDLSNLRSKGINEKEKLHYDLSVSAIRSQFENQLGTGIVINSVFPEEVDFDVKSMKIKKVPVVSNLKIDLKSGFMISEGPIIVPDSVSVRGDSQLVDTLRAIYTEEHIFDNVEDSFQKEIALHSNNEAIKLIEKSVTIYADVVEYIDEERIVEVHPLNFPDSASVNIQPQKVTLKYRTHAKAKTKIRDEDFLLVVDYNTANNFSKKLEVQPISLPEGISKVNMTPRYLNYMITYKK